MWDEPNPPFDYLKVEFGLSEPLARLISVMTTETGAGFTKTTMLTEKGMVVRFAFEVGVHAESSDLGNTIQYVVDCPIRSSDPLVLYAGSVGAVLRL